MPLSEVKIKNTKPEAKAQRLWDANGLYLEVNPKGGKYWRFKYRFGGKEKRLSFGVYPEVSLKEARAKRDEARKLLDQHIDPSENRKAQKLANVDNGENSFEVVTREWINKQLDRCTEDYRLDILRNFEKNVFPWIGKKDISKLATHELLDVLRKLEERGANETARRTRSNFARIFSYAIATCRTEDNPANNLQGALAPFKSKHHSAVTKPEEVGELLRAMDLYHGSLMVACALKLAPLVFVRPGELRTMQWVHINFETEEWRYTVTKTNTPHIVPLAKQAIEILRKIEPLTHSSAYVFPCATSRTRPMSDGAIRTALQRCGISKDKMTGHGFRAMARTILDEVLKFRVDVIEHQLAHAVKDPNGRAYNRTSHLEERKRMMQVWADYLDELKK